MLRYVNALIHKAAMLASASLLVAAMSSSAAAFGSSFWTQERFLGLWEGVDPLDGSNVYVSITNVDYDGVLEINQTESFFTTCAEMGATYSLGRGKVLGTGVVSNTNKNELMTTSIQTCIDDLGTQPGTSLPENELIYTLRSHGRILQLPDFDGVPGILLHRVAK